MKIKYIKHPHLKNTMYYVYSYGVDLRNMTLFEKLLDTFKLLN